MSKDELINKYLQIEEKIEALEKDFPDSLQKQTILQKQSPQTKTKTKIRMRTPILKRPWQALSFNFRKKSKRLESETGQLKSRSIQVNTSKL